MALWDREKAAIMMMTKITGITKRVAYTALPRKSILGTKFLWCVLSISFENSTSSPGMSRNTDSMLSSMAFISTEPMS